MIIRTATINDISDISILIAKFRMALKSLKGIKEAINIDYAKNEFIEYIENDFPIYIALNDDNKAIGYMVCRINDGVIWVESIYVAELYRRTGVATKLYHQAELLAKQLGNDNVYNWIHPNNHEMINFLKNNGYDKLNLIEICKDTNKDTKVKITISEHTYNY